jgi:hypothetical protein
MRKLITMALVASVIILVTSCMKGTVDGSGTQVLDNLEQPSESDTQPSGTSEDPSESDDDDGTETALVRNSVHSILYNRVVYASRRNVLRGRISGLSYRGNISVQNNTSIGLTNG